MPQTIFQWTKLHGLSKLVVGTMTVSLVIVGCTMAATGPEPQAAPDPSTAPESAATAVGAPANTIKLPIMGSPGVPGDWTKPNPNGKAVGEGCTKPEDCKTGICEGQGCDTGPTCAAADRMCTRDLVGFCGCDGKPFASSGSCPGRPYKNKGNCN